MVSRLERDGESESFTTKSPACIINITNSNSRGRPGPSPSPSTVPQNPPSRVVKSEEDPQTDYDEDSRTEDGSRSGTRKKKKKPPNNPTSAPSPPHPMDIEESKRKGRIHIPLSKSGKPTPYYRCAPLSKLKHPLEENIFTSLLITLIAVFVAIICGIPVLILTGALLLVAISVRYLTVIMEGCFQYLRFICSNRNVPANRTRPQIFPVDR